MSVPTSKRTLSAHEFATALAAGEFRAPVTSPAPGPTVRGIARPAELDGGQPDHVLFDAVGDCRQWTKVPLDLIEKVDVLGPVPGQDQWHVLVALTLKQPTSPEGAVLGQLVASMSSQRPRLFPRPLAGRGCGGTAARTLLSSPPAVGNTALFRDISESCAYYFGMAAHYFLAAFEAGAAGDEAGGKALTEQFLAYHALYQSCETLAHTL